MAHHLGKILHLPPISIDLGGRTTDDDRRLRSIPMVSRNDGGLVFFFGVIDA
jgi:hypothetical protein